MVLGALGWKADKSRRQGSIFQLNGLWSDVIWLRSETPQAFEILLWWQLVLLSTLAFCCASEHLSPWIFRGRLKAPVLLRLYFGRAITTRTLGPTSCGEAARPFRGSARSRPGCLCDFTLESRPVLTLSSHSHLLCTSPNNIMSWQGCAH